MSRLSDLKSKIHTLSEIQSILGAMKNLAVIEMSKVGKLMYAQEKMSQTIDAALAEFEFFNKKFISNKLEGQDTLCLLIGSERGFCGPFNERVIESFQKATEKMKNFKVAVIGRKLRLKLGNDSRVDLFLNGPNSSDEIPAVISELSQKLLSYATLRWMFFHNDGVGLKNGDSSQAGSGQHDQVSFPLEHRIIRNKVPWINRPLLNMTPMDLYPQLLEQHLFSIMHKALYISFMAENRERLHHMEGALNQIEKERGHLSLKLNEERQEEITEELEILMLSSLATN